MDYNTLLNASLVSPNAIGWDQSLDCVQESFLGNINDSMGKALTVVDFEQNVLDISTHLHYDPVMTCDTNWGNTCYDVYPCVPNPGTSFLLGLASLVAVVSRNRR